MKDYQAIKRQNAMRDNLSKTIADIAVDRLEKLIPQYKNGTITADEFNKILKGIAI